MIFVIAGICFIILVLCIFLVEACYDLSELFACVAAGAAIFMCISLITALVLGICVSNLDTVDARIEMYEAENDKIEAQIAEVVKQYQEYETEIYTNVSSDSAITLVSLYPELKADTLVQTQIGVYTENNKKVRELKEEQINGAVLKWWLYFGK